MWAWLGSKAVTAVVTLMFEKLWGFLSKAWKKKEQKKVNEENIKRYEDKIEGSDEERMDAATDMLNGTKRR